MNNSPNTVDILPTHAEIRVPVVDRGRQHAAPVISLLEQKEAIADDLRCRTELILRECRDSLRDREHSRLRQDFATLLKRADSGGVETGRAIELIYQRVIDGGQKDHRQVASLVNDLAKIYVTQGNLQVCAPTRATQTLIRNRPDIYTESVLNLIKEGRTTLAGGGYTVELTTDPSDDDADVIAGRSPTVALFQSAVARSVAPLGENGVTLADSERMFELLTGAGYEALAFIGEDVDLTGNMLKLESAVCRGKEDTHVTLRWNASGQAHALHCLGISNFTATSVELINPQGGADDGKIIMSRREFEGRLICAFIAHDSGEYEGVSASLFTPARKPAQISENLRSVPEELADAAALPMVEWLQLVRMMDKKKKNRA